MLTFLQKMFYPVGHYSFYNPFKQSQLAFLIQTNNLSREFDLSHHLPPERMFLLSDMDLYGQPIQNPVLSLALFLPIQVLFVASAICIQLRTLQMLKQEKSIHDGMMTTQARIHIFYWPLFVASITLTDNIYPVSALLPPMFCSVLKFCQQFCEFSFILYTFYAALLRYLCCLHTEKVNTIGRDKVITRVYWAFYLHVFFWTVFTIFTSFNLDHSPMINSCHGNYHAIFLMEKSPLHMMRRHSCALDTGTGNKCICITHYQNVGYN